MGEVNIIPYLQISNNSQVGVIRVESIYPFLNKICNKNYEIQNRESDE